MKHIISLSGGVGSYFTLERVLKKYNKDDVIAVFCDTLFEDGDLYRFLEDIEKHFDIEIKRICVGKTPFELAFDENFVFNSRVASCSKKLKSKPFTKWLKGEYKPDECILYLGIDWTEMHRCKAIVKNYAPYKVEFPMCHQPFISKYEMIEGLRKEGIKVPRLYELGFAHNNCGGFCFKAGLGHFKNLYDKDPERYRQMENKEQELIRRIHEKRGNNTPYGILKRRGKPYTLKQLRESIESKDKARQLSIDEICDVGGCGCFIDEE